MFIKGSATTEKVRNIELAIRFIRLNDGPNFNKCTNNYCKFTQKTVINLYVRPSKVKILNIGPNSLALVKRLRLVSV